MAVLVVIGIIVAAVGGGAGQDTATKDKEEQKAEPVQENEPKEQAKEKEDTGNVAVRVAGTQGVEYSGSYGTAQGQRTVDGTLGAQPDEYEVDVDTGAFSFDAITSSFQKRSPGPGDLRVEIVSDGNVQASQETSAEFGVVTTSWSPQSP